MATTAKVNHDVEMAPAKEASLEPKTTTRTAKIALVTVSVVLLLLSAAVGVAVLTPTIRAKTTQVKIIYELRRYNASADQTVLIPYDPSMDSTSQPDTPEATEYPAAILEDPYDPSMDSTSQPDTPEATEYPAAILEEPATPEELSLTRDLNPDQNATHDRRRMPLTPQQAEALMYRLPREIGNLISEYPSAASVLDTDALVAGFDDLIAESAAHLTEQAPGVVARGVRGGVRGMFTEAGAGAVEGGAVEAGAGAGALVVAGEAATAAVVAAAAVLVLQIVGLGAIVYMEAIYMENNIQNLERNIQTLRNLPAKFDGTDKWNIVDEPGVFGEKMFCPPSFVSHSTKRGICVLKEKDRPSNSCSSWDSSKSCDPRAWLMPTGQKWPNTRWAIPTEGAPTTAGSTIIFTDKTWETNGVPLSVTGIMHNIVVGSNGAPMLCPPNFVSHSARRGICVLKEKDRPSDGCSSWDSSKHCDPRKYKQWPNTRWAAPTEGAPTTAGSTVMFTDKTWETNGVPLHWVGIPNIRVANDQGGLMFCPPHFVSGSRFGDGLCVLEKKDRPSDGCSSWDSSKSCDPRDYILPKGHKWPNAQWKVPTTTSTGYRYDVASGTCGAAMVTSEAACRAAAAARNIPFGWTVPAEHNKPRGCFIMEQAGNAHRGKVFFKSTTTGPNLACTSDYASCICKSPGAPTTEGSTVIYTTDTWVTNGVPLNYDKLKALGAYKDTGNRALRYGPKKYGFTAATCAAECPNYRYVALQDNGWCCCDNDLAHATKYGKSSCGTRGGAWCNYIYDTRPSNLKLGDLVRGCQINSDCHSNACKADWYSSGMKCCKRDRFSYYFLQGTYCLD